jgi:hypothetical protein
LALKINRMCEGAHSGPVVLTEDAALLQLSPRATASAAEPEPVGVAVEPSLNRAMMGLIRQQQDDQVIDLFKRSTLEAIQSLAPSTWEALVPRLNAWAAASTLDRQAMAFSVAYHLMRHLPQVWSRPAVASAASRFAAICHDQVQAGNEFSQLGGLSYGEMRELDQFFRELR